MKISTWKKLFSAALLAVLTCALPALAGPDTLGLGTGREGALRVGSERLVINRYAQVTAPLAQGDTAIQVTEATGYAAGDLVLVLQMAEQGSMAPAGDAARMDLSQEPVGRWELARLASVAGARLALEMPLSHGYAAGVTQVIRVPEYTSVSIPAGRSIVPAPWDGSTGGVVAFLATGLVENQGSVHANGMGWVAAARPGPGGIVFVRAQQLFGQGTFEAQGVAGGDSGSVMVTELFFVPPTPVLVTPANFSSSNDTTPTYSGTIPTPFPADTEIVIFVDGSEVGRVVPLPNGTWTLTPAVPLLAGFHDAYAVASSVTQGDSPSSNTNTFDVDVFPPQSPILTEPSDGEVIPTSTPTFSGTAEPSSTVTVYIDGVPVGTTVADEVGNFSFTLTVPLTDGVHVANVTCTDPAGNTSPQSNDVTFTVDGPPPAPVVITPANGSRTNDNTPTFSGTAEAGSTVTVIVSGTPVGTTTADASGNWTFTLATPLVDGSHTVRATATDAGGTPVPARTRTRSSWTRRPRRLRWSRLRRTVPRRTTPRRRTAGRRRRAAR